MTRRIESWAEVGQPWNGLRTLIVSGDEAHREAIARSQRLDRAVVATPLDMITHLEDHHGEISTVVLAGGFAANHELATFLLEFYPAVRVVDGHDQVDPDTYLPAYG